MLSVNAIRLPEDSLLQRYVDNGSYTDCYTTVISASVTQRDFVYAFYTSWLFKVERFILKWLVSRPSTDNEVDELANGSRENFAAWRVEYQRDSQLLMCDYQAKTRSWLMIETIEDESGSENDKNKEKTRLYFGSAVVADIIDAQGNKTLSFPFRLMLGFHKIYSVLLLASARRLLEKQLATRE